MIAAGLAGGKVAFQLHVDVAGRPRLARRRPITASSVNPPSPPPEREKPRIPGLIRNRSFAVLAMPIKARGRCTAAALVD